MQFKFLSKINSPKDIRGYSNDELVELCKEIRSYTIDTITEIGGHLAPTLGVVELSVALHHVFDTPKDKLVWDVGHQGYAHKLLTGRFNDFKTIRKFNGLSGFLKRSESEYDVIGAGHASTSISAALGIAEARRQKREDFRVAAIIGDGSMTGGLAFEGINNAGHLGKQFLVILNDNEMSISPNVGAISRYFTRLISNPLYNRVRNEFWDMTGKLPIARSKTRTLIKKIEARTIVATMVTAYVSKRSAAIPAQSPTLSPTLSAITAGFLGSSSGIPASTLPTKSAPTSAPLVKIPPPNLAKIDINDAPKPNATSALIISLLSTFKLIKIT